ncbi:MAG: hypothetical protein RL095_2833 [Verrucomicrobiota bacterium]|jgi:REP element-mobilizing transposase RayT
MQSFSALHVHIVFATKDRRHYLQNPQLRLGLYAYLNGVCQGLGSHGEITIGGISDHIHISTDLPRAMAGADYIREIKKASTTWIREQPHGIPEFAWQKGYGLFSVSQSQLTKVNQYILAQEDHHLKQPFAAEFIELLQKHQIAYDEATLWN